MTRRPRTDHMAAFTTAPVIGRPVTGVSFGITPTGRVAYLTGWSGIYLGVMDDEGEPYHMLRDGEIGGIAQPSRDGRPSHGSPVRKFVHVPTA